MYTSPSSHEKIYDYVRGGHHPVHLNDRLRPEQRYKVIHRLRSGGFANVWLCRDLECDSPTYVGVKILMAEESTEDCKHICLPLDQFRIDGPNGNHWSFLYPVLGPRVSCVLRISTETCEKIALQAVQGMASLHSHGICHGDFTPANILLQVSVLDSLSEEEVLEAPGEPLQNEVLTESGDIPLDSTAPKYLVRAVDFYSVDTRKMKNEPCIIGFGESFEVASPRRSLAFLRSTARLTILWVLGCTLFEIRTGRKLFDTFDNSIDDHLFSLILILGKLPEPWWSSEGMAIKTAELREEDESLESPEPRSTRDALARGLLYQDVLPRGMAWIHRDIPEREKDVFADLLGKILRYDPKQGLTAAEIQDHEWFKM
ncbi:kinase-like protein [Hyaloscypha variabilis]